MLKYLVVLLDDTSTSYCHYENEKKESRLIALEDLKAGILFAMKENLMIQFVYPNYELPQEYKDTIYSIDHNKIIPFGSPEQGDIMIVNGANDICNLKIEENKTYVLRVSKNDFFNIIAQIKIILQKVFRLNIVLTDVDTFTENDFDKYNNSLEQISLEIENLYMNGSSPQFNLLTDRLVISSMNNCNAGYENITLAPDGKFYICPAFYQADSRIVIDDEVRCIGDLKNGVYIKNSQLYQLTNAPLCRNCDAYQCKRCIWLNRKTTFEVNTPSHEQCVIAHLERNASRKLLYNIRKHGSFLPDVEIGEISYLDPFDVRTEW